MQTTSTLINSYRTNIDKMKKENALFKEELVSNYGLITVFVFIELRREDFFAQWWKHWFLDSSPSEIRRQLRQKDRKGEKKVG